VRRTAEIDREALSQAALELDELATSRGDAPVLSG